MSSAILNPGPLSISPSGSWLGNDGPWSTFKVGFGTPFQYVDLLVSTTAVQPWVVVPEGCTPDDPSDCGVDRGHIFEYNSSSTWEPEGPYQLMIEENLGYTSNGLYGFDDITLGLPGTGAPSLRNQTLAGIAAKEFYIATWGIRPAATNLSTFNHPVPDLLSNLKTEGHIRSLSWGYTAGAYHVNQENGQGLGSLTLGGYDRSLFLDDGSSSFNFGSDSSRDLIVSIQSITSSDSSSENRVSSLLSTPMLSFIDAGVPHIWLDEASCALFETEFDLTWNETVELYTVNDTLHSRLLERNASITFSLSDALGQPGRLNITLPYGTFDLSLTSAYPGISNDTRYFPLRRASNSSQFTLGRTFLQHAYLIADYERQNFSVHQASLPRVLRADLITIPPLDAPEESNALHTDQSTLGPAAIAGIAIAAVLIPLFLGGTLFIAWRKRKVARLASSSENSGRLFDGGKSELPAKEASMKSISRSEADAETELRQSELDGARKEEMGGEDGRVELGGSVKQELDGGAVLKAEMPTDRIVGEMEGGWIGHEVHGTPREIFELP